MAALAPPVVNSRLHDAVDALVERSIDAFTTQALGEDIVDVSLAIDRLEAERLRLVHRFHRDRGALSDGGGTTVSWLRRCCRMTATAAAYRVHLAKTLGELPATLDSARNGRASFTNGIGSSRPLESTSHPMACSTLITAPTSVAGSSASRPMAACSSSAVSSMPKAARW